MEFVLKSLVEPLPVAKTLQPYLKVLSSRRVRHHTAFDHLVSLLMSDSIEDPKLHEESLVQGVAPAIATARAARKSAKSEEDKLDVGKEVRLSGLQVRYELNGKFGKVISFDQESDNYVIAIEDGKEQLTLKRNNLKKVIHSSLKVRNVCAQCGAEPMGRKFQKCAQCGVVYYCSKACQLANLAVHKLDCSQEEEAVKDAAYDLEDFLSNTTAEEYARVIANGLPSSEHTPHMQRLCSRHMLGLFTPKVLKRMEKAGKRLTENVVFADSKEAAVGQFIERVTPWLSVRFTIEDATANWRPTTATMKKATDTSPRLDHGGTIHILRRTLETNWFYVCGTNGGTPETQEISKSSGLGTQSPNVCIMLLWSGKVRCMPGWDDAAAMDFVWSIGALQASY